MKLMTFDVASACGWALWDLDRSEAAIEASCFRLESCPKGTPGQTVRRMKRRALNEAAPKLFRQHRPDAVVIESPLNNVTRFPKKGKADLVTNAGGAEAAPEAGMDPTGAFLLHQLFTVIDTYATAFCPGRVFEVAPQSWQTILKPYRHAGDTKAASIEACRVLRIQLPSAAWARDNAADAAMIAVWAKGHIQELKLMQRAAEADRERLQGRAA